MYKKILFIICMLLISSWSFAETFRLMDGIEILASQSNNNDKSSYISASIDGQTLTVMFSENLGNVIVEIRNASGTLMDFASLETPSGYLFFITMAGHYTVTFTLPGGDEYYGAFDVIE